MGNELNHPGIVCLMMEGSNSRGMRRLQHLRQVTDDLGWVTYEGIKILSQK